MASKKKKAKKILKGTATGVGIAAKKTFDFLYPPPEKQAQNQRKRLEALKAQKGVLKQKAEIAKLQREIRDSNKSDDDMFDSLFGL